MLTCLLCDTPAITKEVGASYDDGHKVHECIRQGVFCPNPKCESAGKELDENWYDDVSSEPCRCFDHCVC